MGRDARVYYKTFYPVTSSVIFTPNLASSIGPIDQHRANTTSTRGAFVPYILGRRKGGPVVGWVGDRLVKKENRQAGKGGSADKQGGTPIYYEAGWHLLAVGPVFRLNAIYVSGELVWEGPIDSDTTPHGTSFQVSDRESFKIYWGDTDQDINTFLGDASRVGISSRWPGICYVVWNRARLGSAPNWPIYEYDLEVKIQDSKLTGSSPDMGLSSCAEVAGVNGAHAVGQILFADYPHGLALDQALFDLPSLEHLAKVTGAVDAVGLPAGPPTLDAQYDARDVNGDSTVPDVDDPISPWVDLFGGRDLETPAGNYSSPLYKQDGCEGLYFRRPSVDGADVLGDALSVASWNEIESPPFSVFGAITLDPTKLTYASGFVDPEFMNRWVFSINRGSNNQNQISLEVEWDMDFIGSPIFDYDKSTVRPRFVLTFHNGTTQWTISNAVPNIPISRKTTIVFAIILRGFSPTVADLKFQFVGHPDADWEERSTPGFSAPSSLTTLNVGWNITKQATDAGHLGEAIRLNELMFEHGFGGPTPPGMPLEDAQAFVDYLVRKWSCGGLSDCMVSSLLAKDGMPAGEALGSFMEDLGFMLPWNPILGKHQFIPLRKVVSAVSLPTIPSSVLLDPLPAIELPLLEAPADKIVFGFSDHEHGFNESTIAVDDDGAADLATYQRANKIEIPTVVDFKTAGVVAERRTREALAPPARYVFVVSREASRYIFPGRAFYLEGFDDILRCVEVRQHTSKGTAEVTAITDIWAGSLPALYELPAQGTQVPSEDPPADLAVGVVESPAYLLGASPQPAVLVPRIPGSDLVIDAVPHFSNDNVTYLAQDSQSEIVTGGSLLDPLGASGPSYILNGPTFTALGSDITGVLDLSSSLDLWASGYQVALINNEIFFLQGVEALGGTTYRLKGLMRARFDTVKGTHSISDNVFILLSTQARIYQDPLTVLPGKTLYVKSQPFVGSSGLSLASITAVSKVLRGKGLVPMDCLALRTNENRNVYNTGQDVPLKWAYQSVLLPGTGAGMQDAGNATGDAAVDGFFRLRFYTLADALVRTVEGLTSPAYTYTNANLVSDLGGEVGFKVSVTNYKAGYESTPLQITVSFE